MFCLPKASYLAIVCYNFGVECFQRQEYECAVAWLKESVEIGKMGVPVDGKTQVIITDMFIGN